ncbi:MAG: protein kinase, partial [Polyangiaceae bacterium]
MDSTKWLLGLNNRPEPAAPGASGPVDSDPEHPAETAQRRSSRGAALQPDARIGRYQLIRELGSGGMGVVYEAHDPNLDRRVAIKLMLSALDESRLAREARALAKLAHPNVVNVHDVGTADGHLFIAMELVDGTTLRHWLTERTRSFRESLEVLIQAGRGLAAAHAAGLVHRDFKPDNVIVGRDGRVRVVDFGIVGAIGTAEAEARADARAVASTYADQESTMTVGPITAAGAIVGTPAYMAPEQHRAEATDESADQFAFCVVLWELVYGSRPFNSSHFSTLTRGGALAPPSEPPAGRSAPAWLRRILDRGLASDRASRHPSMNALLEALAAGLARHAATAHLLGRRYEKLRPSGSHSGDAERAIDRVTGRLVTIQNIALPEGTDNDVGARVALARAFRELASLRHPNLVGLLDFGFPHDGAPYLVLDQQDAGVDLALAVRQAPRRTLDYLVQILRGLGYLHRHRISLGAIEPRAVRVFDEQVKLVPLGRVGDASPQAHRAPEIASGGPPSVRGDLCAFALLATELLSVQSALESTPSARELESK